MTRAQFLALLAASGVSFVGGAAISYRAGPPASAIFLHALRLELQPDGGEHIEAYATRAADALDGGLDFDDLGPQRCTRQDGGSVGEAVQWAVDRCPLADGGNVAGAYVVEVRSTSGSGDAGWVTVEVYGANGWAGCLAQRAAAMRRFVASLDCGSSRPRVRVDPL